MTFVQEPNIDSPRSGLRPAKRLGALLLACFAALLGFAAAHAAPATSPPRVLILDETVSGGGSSAEAVAAQLAIPGCAVDVVTAANWGSIPASGTGGPTGFGFSAYRAIILGDPFCNTGTSGYAAALAALNATKTTWTPVVTGNVILMGIDNTLHAGSQVGADKTVKRGIAFAVNDPTKTGLYYALSCYYDYTAPAVTPTLVPHLTGFGTFLTRNYPGTCFNAVHQVATHPIFSATPALTDAELSNWSCSTHEGFDAWPPNFVVLAIALTNGVYTATDGSNGVPYILVRGEGVKVISSITLDPPFATNNVGTTHTVCATLDPKVNPRVGVTITFTVVSGPNAGTTGTAVTGTNGVACFTYPDLGGAGVDYITASYVSAIGVTNTSATVTKTWVYNTCAGFGCETAICMTNGVWRYRFCITNMTKDVIQYISLADLAPGSSVTPAVVNFVPPLLPGQMTNTVVTINAPPGTTNFCFSLGMHTTNFVTCCSVRHCVALPECCTRIIDSSLKFIGNSGPTNIYSYTFSFQNLTTNTIKNLVLVPDQPCVTFVPPIVDLSLPAYGGPALVGPGGIRVVTVQVLIVAPCPGPLTFMLATLDPNGRECCSSRVRLPISGTVKLDSPKTGTSVLGETPITLEASAEGTTLRQMQFFMNSTMVGLLDRPPYVLTVRNIPPGTYTFTAVGIFQTGEAESSDGVEVTVLAHDSHVPVKLGAMLTGATIVVTLAPEEGHTWMVEVSDTGVEGTWQPLQSILGDGTVQTVTDKVSDKKQRFYRAVHVD